MLLRFMTYQKAVSVEPSRRPGMARQAPSWSRSKETHRKVGDTPREVDGAGDSGGRWKAQARREQQDEELRKVTPLRV